MIGLAGVVGIDNLDRALSTLTEVAATEILTAALLDAVEPMRELAASLAPRSRAQGKHLADHIIKAIIAGDPDAGTPLAVEVGPMHEPEDFFYGFFQEFGTVHHVARPFMRPAYDETVALVLERFRANVWKEIEKRLPPPQSMGRLL